MRILFIIDQIGIGGAEKQVGRLAEGLRRFGHETIVLTFSNQGIWKEILQEHGVSVEHCTFSYRRRYIFTFPFRFLALARHIARLRPDVVMITKYRFAVWGSLAGWLARVPVIISYRVGIDYGGRYDRLTRFFARLSRPHVTWFVGNSQAITSAMQDIEGIHRNSSFIYQSVELPVQVEQKRHLFREQYRISDETPCVGLLANLYPVKNHPLLIHAARRVGDACPNTRFLLAGAAPFDDYRVQVEQEIAALGLEDRVQLIGPLDDPSGFLAGIDIGVLCSFSEGFSNSLLEYMAYGKPVVATRVGGNPEAVTHEVTGILIDSDDEEALVVALLRLIRQPELRETMGAQARQRIERDFGRDEELLAWHSLLTRLYQNSSALSH